jgi:hypothetical protein
MKIPQIPFAIAGTLLFAYLMHLTSQGLHGPLTPMAVVSLEFASSESQVRAIYNQWNVIENGQLLLDKAIFNTYIDYGFLFFYGLLAYLVNTYQAQKYTNKWQNVLLLSAKCGAFAALLDSFENTLMLVSLNGNISDSIALATFIFASCKFVLIAFSVIIGLSTTFYSFFKNNAKKS